MRAAMSLPVDHLLDYTDDPIGDLVRGDLNALVEALLADAGLAPAAAPASLGADAELQLSVSVDDPVKMPSTRYALQLALPHVVEHQSRARRQVLHGLGHQTPAMPRPPP